jgi:endoglucanase
MARFSAKRSPTATRLGVVAIIASLGAGLLYVGRATHRADATVTLSVRVQGNSLLDGDGKPIRLLGVDRSGTEYACAQGWGIFDGPSDATSIAAMAAWHINAVRVPLNEDCWLGINGVNPAYAGANYRSAIGAYLAALRNAGLIAILDLHWNAPGSTLATGPQVMADADHSPAFWSSVAAYYRNDPAVVFDLYNEPHDISWACWRDGCVTSGGWKTAGMQSLVNAVRSTGATQPVLLGGLGWSSDLSSRMTYRPTDPANQMAASFHVYNFSGCNTAGCWTAQVAPVAASVPVVTGEIGENDCSSAFIAGYMNWADAHAVSYLAWSWDTSNCSSGPALITSYDGVPTAFGAGFRDHLAAVGPPITTIPLSANTTVARR